MESNGGSWANVGEANADDPAPKADFTDDSVRQWLAEGAKHVAHSGVNMVLYGHDGTAKTGAAMDCRNEAQKKKGQKVIIFDLDGSAGPIKSHFHGDDENIVIFDPFIVHKDGKIDYVTTYNKILVTVRYIVEKEDELKLAAVVFDGLDTLLKICEYVMRYQDMKIDANVQIKDSWQWSKRNRHYNTVVHLLKRMKCDKLYTTHLKAKMSWKRVGDKTELGVDSYDPDWEKSTPGMMFQKVMMERKVIEDSVEFVARVEKSKGALDLEGVEHVVAVKRGDTVEWSGIHALLERFRGVKPEGADAKAEASEA